MKLRHRPRQQRGEGDSEIFCRWLQPKHPYWESLGSESVLKPWIQPHPPTVLSILPRRGQGLSAAPAVSRTLQRPPGLSAAPGALQLPLDARPRAFARAVPSRAALPLVGRRHVSRGPRATTHVSSPVPTRPLREARNLRGQACAPGPAGASRGRRGAGPRTWALVTPLGEAAGLRRSPLCSRAPRRGFDGEAGNGGPTPRPGPDPARTRPLGAHSAGGTRGGACAAARAQQGAPAARGSQGRPRVPALP